MLTPETYTCFVRNSDIVNVINWSGKHTVMTENEKDINNDDSSEEKVETPMERFFFHQRRALEETGKALEALLPPDFRRHGGEASREFAKGFRVLVDATIDNLKKVSEKEDPLEDEVDDAPNPEPESKKKDDDDDNRPSTTGRTKVKVKLD